MGDIPTGGFKVNRLSNAACSTRSCSVLAIDWRDGRQVLGAEYANRESQSSWRDALVQLKKHRLSGVELVVSDVHPGLNQQIREELPGVCWQRCYVYFLRNALDYLPRKADDDLFAGVASSPTR